jgi:signal transduction histidine kinase
MSSTDSGGGILVVDDTTENLRLLSRLLGQAGYRARPMRSGAEALAAAHEERPDLVLLDIDMPEMDGYEVCRRFKATPELAEIPIIFLSAMDQTADKVQAFEAGAVDFVTKPFHFHEVRVRIDAQLELARLRSGLRERSEELAESLERLTEVEQLRHDLVHMAAHDMRSPIMAVGGYLELLDEPTFDDAARREFIARARDGVNTILRLVDAMLDLSRLEANRMPIELGEHELRGIVVRGAENLGAYATARIDVEVATGLRLICDASLLARVVANLLANALKVSDESERVAVRAAPFDESWVRLIVEDRGPGIPEELRPRLFEKFATGPGASKKGRSTGLGLAFCRLAMEAQGGRIGYFESDGLPGTRFWIALPRAGDADAAIAATDRA